MAAQTFPRNKVGNRERMRWTNRSLNTYSEILTQSDHYAWLSVEYSLFLKGK